MATPNDIDRQIADLASHLEELDRHTGAAAERSQDCSVPWPRGFLSEALGQSQDRQGWLFAGLPQ